MLGYTDMPFPQKELVLPLPAAEGQLPGVPTVKVLGIEEVLTAQIEMSSAARLLEVSVVFPFTRISMGAVQPDASVTFMVVSPALIFAASVVTLSFCHPRS